MEAEFLVDAALDLAGEPGRSLRATEDDVAALNVGADVFQSDPFERSGEIAHRQRPDAAAYSTQ